MKASFLLLSLLGRASAQCQDDSDFWVMMGSFNRTCAVLAQGSATMKTNGCTWITNNLNTITCPNPNYGALCTANPCPVTCDLCPAPSLPPLPPMIPPPPPEQCKQIFRGNQEGAMMKSWMVCEDDPLWSWPDAATETTVTCGLIAASAPSTAPGLCSATVSGNNVKAEDKCPVTCGKCTTCQSIGSCQNVCNTYLCDHANCRQSQIREKCVADSIAMYQESAGIGDPPIEGVLPAVGMSIELYEPLTLTLETTTSAIVAKAGVQITLQWEDPRLITTPCRALFAEMLSLSDTMSASDIAEVNMARMMYWYPVPSFASVRSTDQSSEEFHLADDMGEAYLQPSHQGNATRPTCKDGCARLTYRTVLEVTQRPSTWGDYRRYPFDEHVLVWTISAEGAALSCDSSTLAAMAALGPTTVEEMTKPPTGEWDLMYPNPAEVVATASPGTCEFRVYLRRSSIVFVVKKLALSSLTVVACLLGNYMHPNENAGNRGAMVLVAILILTATIESDLKLGAINYLIWLDGFYLALIMVCVLALIQTMAVHQLYWWSEQQQLALVVDRVCTATILYFLFPIVVLGCILVDFESTFGIGLFLLIAVLPLSGLTAYMRIRATLRKQAREARAAIGALVSGPQTGPKHEAALRRAFNAFDTDDNGYLKVDEFRQMVRQMHPGIPLKNLRSVVKAIVARHFDHGRLVVDDFIGCQDELNKLVTAAMQGETRLTNVGLVDDSEMQMELERSSVAKELEGRSGMAPITA